MAEGLPLIYILSCGRSGSTLLDLLLGAHPNMWTLGEAEMLPWELQRDGLPCGCGQKMTACPFWQTVLPAIPLEGRFHVGYFRDIHGWGRLLRWELLGDLVKGRVSPKWEEAVHEYGHRNLAYFQAVWEHVEQAYGRHLLYLVDASKTPYRLFWLQMSGLFDIWVVHLVKDPRGFAYSIGKEQPGTSWRRTMRAAGRWTVENLLFERLLHTSFPADRQFFLRYEDLARDPQGTLGHLGAWLGVPFPAHIVHDFREAPNHAVSGNPMRWQNTPIFLDQRWRSALPRFHQHSVWLLTGWLARRYGYPIAELERA